MRLVNAPTAVCKGGGNRPPGNSAGVLLGLLCFMIVRINDKISMEENRDYLYNFESLLYLKYFPNQNEREPFKNIIDRISNGRQPKTDIILFVDNGCVIGGCINDFYPACGSIETIYLVVDERYRNRGIAKMLLDETYDRDDVVDMYVEVDNPELIGDSESSIDPKTRIEIYNKLGFRSIDVEYVQPPLDDGMEFEKNLILMCKTKKQPLTKERIKAFITEFYRCLGYLDSDEYHKLILSIER